MGIQTEIDERYERQRENERIEREREKIQREREERERERDEREREEIQREREEREREREREREEQFEQESQNLIRLCEEINNADYLANAREAESLKVRDIVLLMGTNDVRSVFIKQMFPDGDPTQIKLFTQELQKSKK